MQFDAIDEVKPGYYQASVVEPSLQLIIFLLLSHQTEGGGGGRWLY